MASKSPRETPAAKPSIDRTEHPLDDPALDRFGPQRPHLIRDYVFRSLPGGFTDIEALTAYWYRRTSGYLQNAGLVGHTHSGKTMLMEVIAHVLAERLGPAKPLPFFTLSGSSTITDHDLFGQYRPFVLNGMEQLFRMEGVRALACRVGGIFLLNEINAIPGNVTATMHPVLDDRRRFVNIREPVPGGHGGGAPDVVKVLTLCDGQRHGASPKGHATTDVGTWAC